MTQRKTYAEAAAEMDSLKDTGREFEGVKRVNARVDPNFGIIFSVRFSQEEFAAISDAAKTKGVKLSEIIRAGALREARGDESVAETKKAVKAARKELLAARRSLDRTAQELDKVS